MNDIQIETLLSVKDVSEQLRMSVSSVWKKVRSGELPKPLRISGGMSRWLSSEINDWVRQEIEKRDAEEA